MLQAGGDLDLPEEAIDADRFGDLGMEDLDRHLAVVLQVFGEEDRGHPPAPQLALQAVAVCEVLRQRGEQGSGIGHGASTIRLAPAPRQRAAKNLALYWR